MINRYTYKDSVWVDMAQPTVDEVMAIADEFNVHPGIADELTSPSFKSRVELHRDYIYLILHFPVFKHSHGNDTRQEVDFIIGKKFLVTARYETIDAMDKFAKIVEVNSILDRGFPEDSTGILFFGIVQEIYLSLNDELEYIENWLEKIEEGIFTGEERDMVLAISQVSRNLLNFRKATNFHKEVLTTLDMYGRKIFDEHFSYHVNRLLEEYGKIAASLENNMALVAELRETNNSLLSTKENEIVKTLTILASITFPLTIITGIFGMSITYPAVLNNPNNFWLILAVMAILIVAMFSFFKYKKWL